MHVLKVGTFTFMLEAHLRCPLCGVCWHFLDILIHSETKLLPAAGPVAIDIVFKGSPKPEHQQLEVRVVRTEGPFFVASPEDNGVEECLK